MFQISSVFPGTKRRATEKNERTYENKHETQIFQISFVEFPMVFSENEHYFHILPCLVTKKMGENNKIFWI